MVGDFSQQGLQGWEEKVFENHTRYESVEDGGMQVIQALSHNSASGLFREIEIDLQKTPFMNWSWKVKDVLSNTGERSKQGDDYAARIYVIFSGDIFFWQTRALNYVWSSHQQIGDHWPNAFSSSAHMIAIENADSKLGQWVHEKRNVRADYKRIFGTDKIKADAVAIMTDTDNTQQKAIAYYGNIYFTSE